MTQDDYRSRAFVAISDTHLGLRAGPFSFFSNTVSSRADHVDQFAKWLISVEKNGGAHVPVGRRIGEVQEKKLVVPDLLVLNGDVLELWDASDRTVEFSSHSLFQSLANLSCEKIYTVGNHDLAIEELAERSLENGLVRSGLYPWGRSLLRIFSDTYPIQKKDKSLETLLVGNRRYLFLHGHQFSELSRLTPWWIPSFLRDGAEAYRLYSWVILGAFIASIVLFSFLRPPVSSAVQYSVIGIFGILAVPRIFVSIARPMWNLTRGLRYKRKRAWKGFVDWWKGFLSEHKPKEEEEPIHIVYGHTHLMDILKKSELEEELKSKIQGPDFVLINHPSWVKDSNPGYADIFQAAFLYADEEGFEFFGWDWNRLRPFHVPKEIVGIRASGKHIEPETLAWLEKLGWPEKLIIELESPIQPLAESK